MARIEVETSRVGDSEMVEANRTIGITVGDPAGIGPEIVRAALGSGELDSGFEYRVIGSLEPVGGVEPGKPTVGSARLALEALEESVELLRAGEIAGVVNGPVCKETLQEVGFCYPGQTEFYAARAKVEDIAMMLTGPRLTVGLVTAHVPLRAAVVMLEERRIVRTGRLLGEYLQRVGSGEPGRPVRLAVAGLNPHGGEGGFLGQEELEVIEPSVVALRERLSADIEVIGPISPDSVFREAAEGAYDGVLAMYHDQGLIPLKLLDFDEAVNHTLGLPFVRTSPDHGTAFSLVGTGRARPTSMIRAIQLTGRLIAS